ncbi:hypothetical protein [Geodermatophilus sp. URMC 64]
MTLAQDRPVTPAAEPGRPTQPPLRPAGPPPRPRVTSDLPLPGTVVTRARAPWPVRAGGALWALALLASVVGVVVAAIDSTGLRSDLLDSARAADPDRALSVLQDGADLVLAGAIALTGLALLALLAGVLLLRGRRPAARWALPVAGLLALAAAGIDQGLAEGGATWLDRASFLVSGGLVVLALGLVPLARSSRAWLRRR